MADNLPRVTLDIKPQIQEALKVPSKKNKRNPYVAYITVLLENERPREKNLNNQPEEGKWTNRNSGGWMPWCKIPKEKTASLYVNPVKCTSRRKAGKVLNKAAKIYHRWTVTIGNSERIFFRQSKNSHTDGKSEMQEGMN